MHSDRELAKAICVLVLQYMQGDPGRPPPTTNLLINMKKLHDWYMSCPKEVICERDFLEAAMGYNNFCLEVVTTPHEALYLDVSEATTH